MEEIVKPNKMKAIGIEIDKKKAVCFALEHNSEGTYINLTGNFRYLEIKEDQDKYLYFYIYD